MSETKGVQEYLSLIHISSVYQPAIAALCPLG